MPEYLAPGVYVEEVSYRSKSIEGVSTTTTAFVGPARTGPIEGEPELLTSFSEFERRYGGLDALQFAGSDEPMHNYMAHAVRAFFANGGRRLYVARAFRDFAAENRTLAARGEAAVAVPEGVSEDGVARAIVPAASAAVGGALGGASAAVEQARDTLGRARATAADVARVSPGIVTAAVQALRSALDNLNALLPAPDPAIANIDAVATSAGDIDNIINGIIGGLADPPQGDVQADYNTNVQPAVQARDAAQALAGNAGNVTAAADVQVARLATVENEGTTAGAAVEPIPANAEATAEAAATGVTTAAEAARTAGTAASTARATANTSAAALSTTAPAGMNAAIGQAAADATAALTAATAAITAAQAALDAAVTAFRDGTVGQRAAVAASFGGFRARFPGRAGNMVVRVLARRGPNIVRREDGQPPALQQTRPNDLVWVDGGTSGLFLAQRSPEGVWSFIGADGNAAAVDLAAETTRVHVIIFTVEAEIPGAFPQTMLWTELTADGQRRESIQRTFAPDILNPIKEIETPLVLDLTGAVHPVALGGALLGANLATIGNATAPAVTTFRLEGGNDGFRPSAEEYTGRRNDDSQISSGLVSFEDIEEISIVAAPGLSFGALNGYSNTAAQATQSLLAHCETMRYRVAVLDSPENAAMSQVQNYRAQLDTTRAALYYPWVRIQDPITQEPIHVPPSGFVAGIYARNDINRGVHKAPANEVVNGAIGLETLINKGQQDVLNPRGINCLRYFENRGNRVWGARTLSSDPEWKYLNIRRYFAFLERSIEKSTQWAVFEPNGEALWANVRRSVEDFLYNEWKSEHLAGSKPVEAYFVKCDRTTMSQNDLDNGRMICLIGVAPLYPAEFVIFRIGQWTADRPS